MSVIIRAAAHLSPGCRLYYDCPLKGESYRSEQFFEKYRGKMATFVGYCERLVGELDYKGRVPGRYIDLDGIKVRFDGENVVRELNINHFVVMDIDPRHVSRAVSAKEDQRLGDLPHPILFYPDDLVRFKKKPHETVSDEPHEIAGVFLEKPFADGVPRYQVMETEAETKTRLEHFHERQQKLPEEERVVSWAHEGGHSWNIASEDLELVSRGNVWALYNNPAALSFASNEAASAFWARDGISYSLADESTDGYSPNVYGRPLQDAWKICSSGKADIIQAASIRKRPDMPTSYVVRRLHDCWEYHRWRVRELTVLLWFDAVKNSAA